MPRIPNLDPSKVAILFALIPDPTVRKFPPNILQEEDKKIFNGNLNDQKLKVAKVLYNELPFIIIAYVVGDVRPPDEIPWLFTDDPTKFQIWPTTFSLFFLFQTLAYCIQKGFHQNQTIKQERNPGKVLICLIYLVERNKGKQNLKVGMKVTLWSFRVFEIKKDA